MNSTIWFDAALQALEADVFGARVFATKHLRNEFSVVSRGLLDPVQLKRYGVNDVAIPVGDDAACLGNMKSFIYERRSRVRIILQLDGRQH